MLAKPYRVESRAFSSISRQTACTRTVGIPREIVRLAAFLREDTRSRGFALSHTISRKCNQQFRSGYMRLNEGLRNKVDYPQNQQGSSKLPGGKLLGPGLRFRGGGYEYL